MKIVFGILFLFYRRTARIYVRTFVETAEHFIIFQTKHLNTYDQALHTTYKKVSENDYDPVRVSAFCAPASISTTSIMVDSGIKKSFPFSASNEFIHIGAGGQHLNIQSGMQF